MTKSSFEVSEMIRGWLRLGADLAHREGDVTESVSAQEWQDHDDAAGAIVEAVGVLWGLSL